MHNKLMGRYTLLILLAVSASSLGASNPLAAVSFALAILIAVALLDGILYGLGEHWLASFRPLFSIIVLSATLQIIFLFFDTHTYSYFPLTFLGAFLLAQPSIARAGTIQFRLKLWFIFCLLVVVMGGFNFLFHSAEAFPAAPFFFLALIAVVLRVLQTRFQLFGARSRHGD